MGLDGLVLMTKRTIAFASHYRQQEIDVTKNIITNNYTSNIVTRMFIVDFLAIKDNICVLNFIICN